MSLEVTTKDINIYDIIEKSDLTSDIKKKLKNSKLILFPASFSKYHQRGDFPSETPDLLRFIRVEHPEIDVTLFENNGEEKIQALLSADIILPLIYHSIQNYSIQIIISLLSAYLYDKFKGEPDLDKKIVKTEILCEDADSMIIKYINYKGPVSGLKEIEKIMNFK